MGRQVALFWHTVGRQRAFEHGPNQGAAGFHSLWTFTSLASATW